MLCLASLQTVASVDDRNNAIAKSGLGSRSPVEIASIRRVAKIKYGKHFTLNAEATE